MNYVTVTYAFMDLNSFQKEAVLHTEGPLLVFAGAGSGKTRVITNRIAYMIQEKKISASHIVALSFTNKSAKEMETRLRKMLPKMQLRGIVLSTFHSLGFKILKEHITNLGYNSHFLLMNSADQEDCIRSLLISEKVDPRDLPLKEIAKRISLIKNTRSRYLERFFNSDREVDVLAAKLYPLYEKNLKERNVVDFDDLILLPLRILTEFPEISGIYHKRFCYFMVDEFQDTNELQYEFLSHLLGSNRNLCVVGDDDQSIYAFRGSNVQLILNFEKDFPDAKVVRLLENYRSSDVIIKAANSVIQNNTDRRSKELYSRNFSTEKLEYYEAGNEREEASLVVGMIEDYYRKKIKPREIAILYRTNFQSRPFEEELRMRSLPYKVVGGYHFFDRKEVRDLIAYLRIIANSRDENSLIRTINTPKRGIGQGTLSRIHKESMESGDAIYRILEKICSNPDYLPEIKSKSRAEIYKYVELIELYRKKFRQDGKMATVLRELILDSGLEREILREESDEKVAKARIYYLNELVNMLSFFEEDPEREEKPNLFDFLARLAFLMQEEDKEEKEEDQKIQLLTIHQSKGLEFEIVFVVGMEEGILPNSRVLEETGSLDEERRLFYVAMTRAKTKLFLTSSKCRRKYGENIGREPSRFLSEIDPGTIVFKRHQDEIATMDFIQELEALKKAGI